jgi:hypothetical protein
MTVRGKTPGLLNPPEPEVPLGAQNEEVHDWTGLALRRALAAAARGKRHNAEVARFMLDPARQLAQLAPELTNRTYTPGSGCAFWIHDPKPRRIFALPFRDRVVQHLLMQATLPRLENWFAHQSYACRSSKGSHRCLKRAIELTGNTRFVLRLDIRKFFPSIDHALLQQILAPHTPMPWRWLRDRILNAPALTERVAWHFAGDDLFTPLARLHGLPIGSLTSQIWANAFLTPVDHMIASQLGIGTFVRYCDDILVFDNDAERLKAALCAIQQRVHGLRLRLHPEKTRLHRTSDPVSFLGFVLRRVSDGVRVHLRSENTRRFCARMAETQALYDAGAIGAHEVVARVRAWLAHARHGHTQVLCDRMLNRLAFTRATASAENAFCKT